MKRWVKAVVAVGGTVVAAGLAGLSNLALARFVLAVPEDAVIDASVPVADGAEGPAEGGEPAPRPFEPGEEPAPPTPPTPNNERAWIDPILARNLFDSTKVDKPTTGGEPGLAMTDLNVKLLATVVASIPEYSSALIAESAEATGYGYGIGQKLYIGGKYVDAEVVEITQRKVGIKRGDGTVEYIVMDEGTEKPAAQAGGGGGDPYTEGEEGIRQIDETHYEIDRSTLDKYLGDLDALQKMARGAPHKDESGNADGYRLSGIRRTSPLSKVGIKNGDVVHSVNGKSLTNVTEGLAAMQTLQSSSSFTFEITRRNQKMTLEYSVK